MNKKHFDPTDPRSWDNLGTIATWHRRYDLGDDPNPNADPDAYLDNLAGDASDQIADQLRSFRYRGLDDEADDLRDRTLDANYIILPVYMYDHGNIALSTTGFSCPWDSGQLGIVYVDREKILREFSRKRMSRKLRAQAEKILRAEVEIYSRYLSGELDDDTDEFEENA